MLDYPYDAMLCHTHVHVCIYYTCPRTSCKKWLSKEATSYNINTSYRMQKFRIRLYPNSVGWILDSHSTRSFFLHNLQNETQWYGMGFRSVLYVVWYECGVKSGVLDFCNFSLKRKPPLFLPCPNVSRPNSQRVVLTFCSPLSILEEKMKKY
jgi:hypothetical protein